MAEPEDEDAPRRRVLLLAALFGLAGATGLVFGRVYQGAATTWKLVLAGCAAVAIGALLERANVGLATLASAVGLLFAVGILVFPETTAVGIPTVTTFEAIGRALHDVGITAAREVAPAPPLPAILLAGLVAMWTAFFAAHLLAARAGTAVLALIPPAALVGFGDVVLVEGARPAHVVAFLAAALFLLLAVGLRRLERWGPIVGWSPRSSGRLVNAATARGARRIALLALFFAAVLPWVFPGFGKPPLYKVTGGGLRAVSIDPIVDLRPSLILSAPVELFSVDTNRPAYWRLVSLDTFDGQRWRSADLQGNSARVIGGDARFLASSAPEVPPKDTLVANVHIENLQSLWLPMPFDPVEVRAPRELKYDDDQAIVVIPGFTRPGLEYRAVAKLVVPSPSQLLEDFSDDPVARGRYLQLPSDLPPEVKAIATRITAGKTTMYERALAIQNYLRTFTYDERVPPGHDTNHLLRFLTETKRGYCEQFAGAMAVLLRAIGIPARPAVGFTPGVYDAGDQRWHVTTENAHAWVEVHFGQYGWLPFEPTPGRTNPVADSFQSPPALPGGGPTDTPTPAGENARELQRDKSPDLAPAEDAGGAAATGRRVPVGLIALGIAAFFLLAALVFPLRKLVSRRLALARARDGRGRVLAAYDVFSRRAGDVGFGRRPGETLWEYRARLREQVQFSDGQLERLTGLAGRAAYADRSIDEDAGREALGLARTAAGDVRRGAGRLARVLGAFRPGN